jgi:ABC-type Fe3+/spermidine/putrescine transport system ATPase subunit
MAVSVSSFTTSELTAAYSGTSILPSDPISNSDRSNGLLTETKVRSIVDSHIKSGIVPTPAAPVEVYDQKAKAFIANAQKEYNFYNDRYKYTVQQLISIIASGYNSSVADTQTGIQNYLRIATGLNVKMNDCIQLIKGVSDNMTQISAKMKADLDALNKTMAENQEKLKHQSKIISSNQATSKINKEMMKYSEEKARYNDNLLKMYSFLNVVALGLLVYIYRAAE